MSKEIVDQWARDKIKNELSTNFLIEAGAGSGKTTSLVERIVNLIYTGTCTVDKIVAITFTRKAADELKVRFQSKLEQVWKKEQDIEIKSLLSNALENIDQCFLGTVHSFCAKLLRERPIEANLDLSFSELEEEEDLDLLEEAWQSFLQNAQMEKPMLLEAIEELGISIDELYSALRELKEFPDVDWMTQAVTRPNLRDTFDSLLSIVREAKGSMPSKEPAKGYDVLQRAILKTLQKVRHMEKVEDKDIIEIFELYNKKLKPTYNRWDSKDNAIFYFDRISSVFDMSIKPLLKHWKEYCHPVIMSFLQEALTGYELLKKERSLLNFQDLLMKTGNLLKYHSEVRKYFQNKYQYLLVDEFQDTDPIQAEIMFYITSENHDEKIWTKCKPRTGSLFVVGDPKQAIYRFRRADIDTYNRVKQLIEEHDGEVLQLTMNFRTVSNVTDELNVVFQDYLPEKETEYQAAFRPLNSFHVDAVDILSGVKTLSVPSEYNKKEDVIFKDAENIGHYIHYLIKVGYHPRDFMILTRYNEGITVYSDVLEGLGIPVSLSGQIIIGEMVEFRELSTLFSVFVDPTDEISFVAAIRGLFFGISDDELYQWKQAGGRFSIYSHLPENLSPPLKEKFEKVFSTLRRYQKWIRTLAPMTAMEKIIEDIGFYPSLLLNKQGKGAYKSLVQIFSAIRKYETNHMPSYKNIYLLFHELMHEKSVVINIEEGISAVRVMNIHKAKGLEAPIVFLSQPIKKVSPENFLSRHIKREDYGSKGYFTFTVKNGFQTKEIAISPSWDEVRTEELRYLIEEEIRIVYVAATRAEKAVIISSSAKSDSKNPWEMLLQMKGIEQLKVPELEFEKETKSQIEITLEDYLKETASMDTWIEENKELSYQSWSPTEDKDYSLLTTLERQSGGGKEWGTLIHDILEKVVDGTDVEKYIKHSLRNYNISPERESEVWEYIGEFKKSNIWSDIQMAEQVLTEVPFSIKIDSDHELYTLVSNHTIGNEPKLVKGVIDLAYKINGKWTIIDYKTDRPKNEEDFHTLNDFYSAQIEFYKRVWEYMTGEKVINSRLFFIRVTQQLR